MPIGVILPFSGERAAVGANIERALILAEESINAAGGIAGEPISLDVADSHSDPARAQTAGTNLIEDNHVQVLIGPEEAGAALALRAVVEANDCINVQASLTSPAIVGPDTVGGYWFRLTPDAVSVADALVARMLSDGVKKSSVFFDSDDYNVALDAEFSQQFAELGGTTAPAVPFQSGQTDFSSIIQELVSFGVNSVVLPAAPGTAEAIIEQWGILGTRPFSWYFTPDLKTPVFARGLPSGVVDGMVGISPSLGTDAAAFAVAFADRWSGEQPLDAAYFYYDALVVTSLAWAAASAGQATPAANSAVRSKLVTVSSGPGVVIHFSDLARGFELARQGQEFQYEGVTGADNFDVTGVAHRSQTFSFWTIHDREIVSGVP